MWALLYVVTIIRNRDKCLNASLNKVNSSADPTTAGFTIFPYIVALVKKWLYVHLDEFLHEAMIPFVGAKPTDLFFSQFWAPW